MVDTTAGHATRKPATKQEATARGATFHNDTEVYHESELEHRVSIKIQGRNDVRELHSQFPVLLYIDDEGVIHKHTSDYYVVFSDGFRLAVAVKYDRKRSQMKALINNCRKAGFSILEDGRVTVGGVDDMKLLTETDATIDDFENGQCIIQSRKFPDPSRSAALYETARKLPGVFRFGELLRGAEHRGKQRTAVWHLIDLGHLLPVSPGRIDDLAWLRFRG